MLKPNLALRILTLPPIKTALLNGSLTPCNDNLQRKGSKIQCTMRSFCIEVFSPLFNGDLSFSSAKKITHVASFKANLPSVRSETACRRHSFFSLETLNFLMTSEKSVVRLILKCKFTIFDHYSSI